MARVGERLREERERRNKTIDDLAEASRIDRRYLDALERGDVAALPGRAFGKLYIRAYAETLGFDAQPLIEEYDREQRAPPEPREELPGAPRPVEAAITRWREAKIAERQAASRPSPPPPAPEPEVADPVETIAASSPAPMHLPSRGWPPRTVAVASGSLLLVAAAAWLVVTSWTDSGSTVPVAPAPTPELAPPVLRTEPEPEPEPETRPVDREPSHLSVAESGVGRRVVGRRLEGRTDRFATGEVAWFLTQVVGGAAGESVRHVWLHDGRVVYSIELALGGREWRTYSRATLVQGGAWTVEARDADGRVLVRVELEVG